MAITQNTYTGDGTTVLFTISFPYLEQDHVKASLNGTPTTAFTFANSNTIQFNVAPANGVTILLFRETESGELQNQFFPNSSIPSSSLNNNFTQGLYVAQETDNTSNQALSDAQSAVTTANAAVVTANTAESNSLIAISTADTAELNSLAAISTANTAESNSLAAVSTANSASSAAAAAVITANTAAAAVAAAAIYIPVADLTALALLTPSDGEFFELQDSTGAESDPSITGVTVGLVGSAGLTFRLRYDDPPGEYAFLGYFANDSETRYLKLSGGTLTGQVLGDNSTSASTPGFAFDGDADTGLGTSGTNELTLNTGGTARLTIDSAGAVNVPGALTKGSSNVVTVGDTGTVTSTMILDGTIVDGDINASAAIVDTKLATIATAGKVSNSATTATSSNTVSAIVARDGSGNFSAGTITADLAGNASTVTTNANLTGDVTSVGNATSIASGVIVDADVNASAAIAGTKISPDFGSQNLVTTGTATAASLIPTGSSVPANGVYLPATNSVAIATNSTHRVRIDSSGNVGIGTTSPGSYNSEASDLVLAGTGQRGLTISSTNSSNSNIYFADGTTGSEAYRGVVRYEHSTDSMQFWAAAGEAFRVDSSKRLLVGTSTSRNKFYNSAVTVNPVLQIEGASSNELADSRLISHVFGVNLAGGPNFILGKTRSETLNGYTVVQSGDQLGVLSFQGADGTDLVEAASIKAEVDGTPGANDMPGRLVFSTTADGASSPTERYRINSSGDLHTGTSLPNAQNASNTGFGASQNGFGIFCRSSGNALNVCRQTNDGDLIDFYQAGTKEGSISVSGTTVSYNGAHLSRWSQLPGGAEREEILRGTVLSNIDEMCGWGNEDNEQLNRMKVSDVEGDKNVSGVFQAWDDDDDTYADDFYCAMTGDFIIRIAEGVTVQRGDLLMSAGDGTAKPQDDDIIRSKTVAKVTSTHVTCTYDDGSYCVPCVLMAC
jgi:hypothetical protein